MELIATGRLFVFEQRADAFDVIRTIALENDGVVKPLAMLFNNMINDIAFEDRVAFYKAMAGKPFLTVKVGSEEIVTDCKIDVPYYSIRGWEHNDDDAQESNSGVDFTDTFMYIFYSKNAQAKKTNELFDLLSKHTGSTVEIKIFNKTK